MPGTWQRMAIAISKRSERGFIRHTGEQHDRQRVLQSLPVFVIAQLLKEYSRFVIRTLYSVAFQASSGEKSARRSAHVDFISASSGEKL